MQLEIGPEDAMIGDDIAGALPIRELGDGFGGARVAVVGAQAIHMAGAGHACVVLAPDDVVVAERGGTEGARTAKRRHHGEGGAVDVAHQQATVSGAGVAFDPDDCLPVNRGPGFL